MPSKNPKINAPTQADEPFIAPLMRVSNDIMKALIETRKTLANVEDDTLISTALECANNLGLTWRICENAAPQQVGTLVLFQFRVDLLHDNGDIMYGYDIMNIPIEPVPGELLPVTVRALAHFTFVKSLFAFLPTPVESFIEPVRPPHPAPTTDPGLTLQAMPRAEIPATQEVIPTENSLEPAEVDTSEEEEEIDLSYLRAQVTPDGIPVLVDLWEASDRKGTISANPEQICEDAVALLVEYAKIAPTTGQLNAAWQHNAPQLEFVRDYDKAEFDKLVDAFNENQNRIQEAPDIPQPQRGRRRRQGRKT